MMIMPFYLFPRSSGLKIVISVYEVLLYCKGFGGTGVGLEMLETVKKYHELFLNSFLQKMGGRNMLRIGICDDDENFLKELEGELSKYADGKDIMAEIELFAEVPLLLAALEKRGLLDILFLDIELKQGTGIEVGKRMPARYINLFW